MYATSRDRHAWPTDGAHRRQRVKVGQGNNWIDSYREVAEAKSVLKETTAVRRTRAGHILIELTTKATAGEVADNIKKTMWQGTEIVESRDWNVLETRCVEGLLPI